MTAQIDAIRKRLSRITPGWWGFGRSLVRDDQYISLIADQGRGELALVIEMYYDSDSTGDAMRMNEADAAFIEHAPADMTALLAALDAANAEIARLRWQCVEGDHR